MNLIAEMQYFVSFVWVIFRHNKLINDILHPKLTTLRCKIIDPWLPSFFYPFFLLMKSVGSDFWQSIYENLKTKTNKIYEFMSS